MDIAAMNRAQLKALFPAVFTETKNDKGELTESIDFEKLKAELGTFSDQFESRRERYGMEWPGKREALHLSQKQSFATLKPCREESVNFDTTENLFIEGDNLEVLKLLQSSYYGKVKMIYIDPPYNTGKEFIYPDNFSESLETYLEYAGQQGRWKDSQSANSVENPRFHTRWLNMMYPRLYLAKNLLRDDGVIFISIDDNEVTNLRKICDEIFGEENFISELIWERAFSPKNDARFISNSHDFVLMYVKSINHFQIGRLNRTEEANARYTNPDHDPRGYWMSSDISVKTYNAENDYPITTPSGRVIEPPAGRCWSLSKNSFFERLNDNRIWFGPDGDNTPRIKRFLSELRYEGMVPTSILFHKDVGHSQEGAQEVVKLFDGQGLFDGPKPKRLIKRLLTIANTNKDSVILDFFAGSASTAHAVLDLNRQDNGNRTFILVQLPEQCAPASKALLSGFKTIADIGKERIRRVIKKLNAEDEGKLDLDQTDAQDRGFKVLKLDKSNFKQWQPLPSTATPDQVLDQLSLHIDHIEPQAKPEDLLYEILLKSGFMLTEPLQVITLAGKTVYSVGEGSLLLCLEETVTKELVDAVIETNPQQFICLDSAFHGNDQLKANAVQTFAARNMQKEKHNQIVFRTV